MKAWAKIILTGLLASALVAAALVFGPTALSLLPLSAFALPGSTAGTQAAPLAQTAKISVPPGETDFVCPPGVAVPPGLEAGSRTAAPVAAPQSAAYLSLVSGGKVTAFAPLGAQSANGGENNRILQASPGSQPLVGRVLPEGTGDVQVAGTTVSKLAHGEVAGLAAAPCARPAAEQWLVGGSTELLHTAKLVIANPSNHAATAELHVFGALGEVPLGSRGVLSVPAGQSVALQVEALAPEQTRLKVQVKASGALVSSSIQTTASDGLTSLGMSQISSSGIPRKELTFVGVVSAGEGIEDWNAPTLRLLSPATDTTASIAVFGPNGQVRLRGAETADLAAGRVQDVSLGGLPAGKYAVVVTAADPVIGAVRMIPASTVVEPVAVAPLPVPSWPSAEPASGFSARAASVTETTPPQVDAQDSARPPVETTPPAVEPVETTGPALKFGETWLAPTTAAPVQAVIMPPDLTGEIVLAISPSATTANAAADAQAKVIVNGKETDIKIGTQKTATLNVAPAKEPRVITVEAPAGSDTAITWSLVLRDPNNNALTALLVPTPAVANSGAVAVNRVIVTK